MNSTKNTFEHHLKCFGAADLNGILSDYSDDVVLFTPVGPIQGKPALKSVFESMFAEFAKPGASFAIQHQSIVGNYAYLNWTGETADNRYEAVSELIVMKDGKILAHSFGGKIISKTRK